MYRSHAQRCPVIVFALSLTLMLGTAFAPAAPVAGKQYCLPQPDGTRVEVRIWGDEFYGITESLDGYALVRDPGTQFFCYARLAPDGNDLLSTGVPVGMVAPNALGLAAHLRINRAAAQAKARDARARWKADWARVAGERSGPRAPTSGNVVGICLIVDFSDDVGTIPSGDVANYCNQPGYTGFGNNGSVRDYYYYVSHAALVYTNYVPGAYYRAAHPKTYYTDPEIEYGVRAQELIIEALTYLENHAFDFSQYDADDDGIIDALNCFYAGDVWNNWAEGLWPHASEVSFCADGVCTSAYQISDMGDGLSLRTFCHENGHMLMGWPDLYDYDYDSTGVGMYCLMAYSTSDTNPCEPCAYLKAIAGWSWTMELTVPQLALTVPALAANRYYRFERPGHPNEYYLVENRRQEGRDSELPDAGLLIWHIDTQGDNSNNEMTPESHYLVTLVQADGNWDLENNANYGDSTDLWGAPDSTQCTPSTNPDTNWWTGAPSGLSLTSVSTPSYLMSFSYFAPACTAGIVAWGDNQIGQCNVPAPNIHFAGVSTSGLHVLGLKAEGTITAWGNNGDGQCTVPWPNANFTSVAAGGYHSLGLKSDGSIQVWGRGYEGQLYVPSPNSGFVAVAAGYMHCLGLRSNSTITAWGDSTWGQTVVPPGTNGAFVAIGAGTYHSLGLHSDGVIVAWGNNNYYQCNVPSPNSEFVAIAAGGMHSLGLKSNGSIVAWGYNQHGQCDVPAPNSGFVAVAAGGGASYGLKADGSIVAWGLNSMGQCNVPSPNTGFAAMAAGGACATALRAFGAGDLNCDGAVNNQDIDPFVLALFNPAGYAAQYPACDILNGDLTRDGVVNNQDIDGFVAALFGA